MSLRHKVLPENYKDPFFNIKLSRKNILISKRDKDAKFVINESN